MVLQARTLYLGDNGRCHCGALACAGMQAHFSGISLDGVPCVPLVNILRGAGWIGGDKFQCEGCGLTLADSRTDLATVRA